MAEHRFFHVDRFKQLKEGQEIRLNERGLSMFGAQYWDHISSKRYEELSDEQQRESMLEAVRSGDPQFHVYTSRLQSFFGANSLEDARRFLANLNPRLAEKVPIFEVFASKFWTLDMNWLDYCGGTPETRRKYLRNYWYAAISNHAPETGERRPPLLEVVMALPVRVGRVVDWA